MWLRPTNRSNKTLIYIFSVTKQRLVMCAEDFIFIFKLCYTAAVCFQQCSGVDSGIHRVIQQATVDSVVEPQLFLAGGGA